MNDGKPEYDPFVSNSLFGGSGDVDVWDLLRGAQAAPFSAILRCELAPAGHVGRHRQEHCPEILIGLCGVGEVRIDGQAHALTSGSVLHLPLGSVLEIINHSDDTPLGYFIIKATPHA